MNANRWIPLLVVAGPVWSVASESSATAFLGVGTRKLPAVVAEHLGLDKGTGLSVVEVAPDSPAGKAGLQAHDVIARLDAQLVMYPEQLATLIRNRRPGDTVKVHVLRDQKPMDFEIVLGERPAGLADAAPDAPVPGEPDVEPDDFRPFLGVPPGFRGMPELERQLEQARQRMADMEREMQRQMEAGGGGGNVGAQIQVFRMDQGKLQIMDGEGSITVEKQDGKTRIVAKDAKGNVTYEGPYETEEEKARVPEDVRKRASRFKIENGGMRLENWFCEPAPGGGVRPGANAAEGGLEGRVKPGDRVD